MTHEEKKVAKIIEELTIFFFAIGAEEIHSGIKRVDAHHVEIDFESDFDPDYADKLDRMSQYLNEEKNEGMEDIYWELAGSGDPGETSQLLLVGMMTDKADVSIEGNVVKLKLYKELL